MDAFYPFFVNGEGKKKVKDGRDVSSVEEEVLDTVRDKEARGPVQTTPSETSTNT